MSTVMVEHLREALTVAGYQPGDRFEVAAIKDDRIRTWWWSDPSEAADSLGFWEGKRNLYLLANPIRADAAKRDRSRAKDADCVSARTLLIDVDPVKVKPKDVAKAVERGRDWPTDVDIDELGTRPDKLEAAAQIADELRAFLRERLGVSAPLVSSGRGRQLWLRADADITPDVRRRLVRGLAERFDRPRVATLDVATYNEARLMRLPGSTNLRTGERAQVLDAGDGPAAAELLAELAEELEPRPAPRPARARPLEPLSVDEEESLLEDALQWVDADERKVWRDVGMALRSSDLPDGVAFDMWDRWSSTGQGYKGQADQRQQWRSFSSVPVAGGVTTGTIYHRARQAGWSRPPRTTRRGSPAGATVPPPAGEPPQPLPVACVTASPRAVTSDEEALALIRSVTRHTGGPPPVVQDRGPTGSGKTTRAAAELVAAARDTPSAGSPRRFLWASPSHDHARQEVLVALAKAGAAIWDEDLDDDPDDLGPSQRSTRDELRDLGALILPVGEVPADGSPTAAKTPPFECPGPDVPGWDPDKVKSMRDADAARGWNPAATVCRACPRLNGRGGADPCSWWERKRAVEKADVVAVPHHALHPSSGAAKGRRALVVDEDPSGALVRVLSADKSQVDAFRALVRETLERSAARVEDTRDQLEQAEAPEPVDPPAQAELWDDTDAKPTPDAIDRRALARKLREELAQREDRHERLQGIADAVEPALAAVAALVDEWDRSLDAQRQALAAARKAKESPLPVVELPPVVGLARPEAVDVDQLEDLADLRKACESTLRSLSRRGEQLRDESGEMFSAPRNLFNLLAELGRLWRSGQAAVIHSERGKGRSKPSGVLPTVAPLPRLPILALDATGDPRLLELASGRPVQLIEGALTARLRGLHLAGAPCGRRRYKRRPGKRERGGGAALAADADVIVRHARRVGASRVGLVTYKAIEDELSSALGAAGLSVRSLHFGATAGSNAFEGWPDLVVVLGAPFVPPGVVRQRAALEGAGVEELLATPMREAQQLPDGGGMTWGMTFPGAATERAYAALVSAGLEQALGRACRWDWTPRFGVLVLAETWATRHELKVTTRYREALDGPVAMLADALAGASRDLALDFEAAALGESEDAIELVKRALPAALGALGDVADVARLARVSERAARYWLTGERLPDGRAAMSIANALTGRCSDPGSLVARSGSDPRNVHEPAPDGERRTYPGHFVNSGPKYTSRAAVQSRVTIDMGGPARNRAHVNSEKLTCTPTWPNRTCQSTAGKLTCRRSPLELLEAGLELAGSPKQLADSLGVNVRTVWRWRRRARAGDARAIGKDSLCKLQGYVGHQVPRPTPIVRQSGSLAS